MASTNSNYVFRISVPGPNPFNTVSKRLVVRRLMRFVYGIGTGNRGGMGNSSMTIEPAATAATGTLTIASGSGTVGGTINGVAVTVTWATSDTATATALAAAINASANALVSNSVAATSVAGVVTLTAKTAGYAGNWVTLAASGTGVTASAARLTGGGATTTYSYAY